jgi:hypothetical protein
VWIRIRFAKKLDPDSMDIICITAKKGVDLGQLTVGM